MSVAEADRLGEILDRVEAALTVGDLEGAREVEAGLDEKDGAPKAAARALLSAAVGDTAGLFENLVRALRQRPGHPRLLCLLAAARALTGDLEAAEEQALLAVAADDGARSWETLGTVLAAAGKWDQAEQAYRKALEHEPGRYTTLLEHARMLGRIGLPDEMLDDLAEALERDPDDHRPLEAVVQSLVGDAAVGLAGDAPPEEAAVVAAALALGARLRDRDADRSARATTLLDLAVLRLSAAAEAPEEDVAAPTARVVEAGRAASTTRRIALAALLASVGRPAATRGLLADLALEGLSGADRGRAAHALGDAAALEGRPDEAVGYFEDAVAADPGRWQSACNALQILLGAEGGSETDRMGALLERVDERARRAHPPLVFNEALYEMRVGREDAARERLADVRRRVAPDHPLATYAAEVLAELDA